MASKICNECKGKKWVFLRQLAVFNDPLAVVNVAPNVTVKQRHVAEIHKERGKCRA